jgi:hypothetical protein
MKTTAAEHAKTHRSFHNTISVPLDTLVGRLQDLDHFLEDTFDYLRDDLVREVRLAREELLGKTTDA